jgi:hypothetical protein
LAEGRPLGRPSVLCGLSFIRGHLAYTTDRTSLWPKTIQATRLVGHRVGQRVGHQATRLVGLQANPVATASRLAARQASPVATVSSPAVHPGSRAGTANQVVRAGQVASPEVQIGPLVVPLDRRASRGGTANLRVLVVQMIGVSAQSQARLGRLEMTAPTARACHRGRRCPTM